MDENLIGALFDRFGRERCEETLRPFFYGVMNLERVRAVPAGILPEWREAHRRAAVRGLALRAVAERACRAIAGRGVRAAPFKGAAFDGSLYPREGLRPASDVDLLVAPADFTRAAAALMEEGFECEAPFLLRPERKAKPGSLSFVPTDGPKMPVDLHCSVLSGPGVKAAALGSATARALTALIDPSRFVADENSPSGFRLPWEETVALLIAHYYRHDFKGDLWLLDFYLLFSSAGPTLDFERIEDIVKRAGVGGPAGAVAFLLLEGNGGEIMTAEAARGCGVLRAAAGKKHGIFIDRKGFNRGKRTALRSSGGRKRLVELSLAYFLPSPAYLENHYKTPVGFARWPLYLLRRWRELIG